jgi:ElaB/YqjD/DUF883 family membrane-anchored ribosome-binding protein
MNALREARLRRDLNNVAGQVQGLIEKLGNEGSDKLDALRERMSSVAAGARDKWSELDMRDSARQAARYTDTYVRDNPWRAIGIGAAAGLLIGYLVSRR